MAIDYHIKNATTHGLSRTKEYKAWQAIKERCLNINCPNYINYGNRGISIQKDWIDNPISFIEYVRTLSNFGKENYSIDRIDNDGNYETGNLQWATKREQQLNRRIKGIVGHNNIYKNGNGFIVRFKDGNIRTNVGTYKTIPNAIIARDRYLRTLKI